MDSLLEKITLYDILGYMVPGAFFWILILMPLTCQITMEQLEIVEKPGSILLMGAIVIVYISGLALSELAKWMVGIEGILKKLFEALIRSFRRGLPRQTEWPVSQTKIRDALIKSRLVEQAALGTGFDVNKYYHLMNVIVKADTGNKRIHNYASAVVLYKNLVCASIGSFIMGRLFSCMNHGLVYDMICAVLALIFFVRQTRFENKIKKYTVIFFVDRYLREQ